MSLARFAVPSVPASFFGMVLGLIGLGNSWRAARDLWGLPAFVGEVLMAAGAAVWVVLLVLFFAKWIGRPGEAVAEALHPVQCCFIGLVGVSTMLVGVAAQPYSHQAGIALCVAGAAFTFGFAVWRTGGLWHGERDDAATTPVLYLPTVAGSFVAAIAAGALGAPQWGRLALGAGLLSWLAIESVLLHRFYTAPILPPALRPTLGIQLAPPAVGAVAYLSVTSGPPDLPGYALVGYALLQLLVLARLLPWILEQKFSPAYWSFTFGLTALATVMLRMTQRGDDGPVATLAPAVFMSVSAILAVIIAKTIWLLVSGRLLPSAPVALPRN